MTEIPLIATRNGKFATMEKRLIVDEAVEVVDEPVELSTEKQFILKRMVRLAPFIRDNKQLKQILRKIAAAEREAFYELLKPYLSFKPKPFLLLKP